MSNRKFKRVGINWLLMSFVVLMVAVTGCGGSDGPANASPVDTAGTLDDVAESLLKDADIPAPLDQAAKEGAGFVRVEENDFTLKGKTYHYVGTNYWQAMNLASLGTGGNREQFLRELDALKTKGITNLRIVAASEGPDTEPLRMVPALLVAPPTTQSPATYNEDLRDGLDFVLAALRERDMKAIMVMGNMWHWSGGFGQYLVWAGTADSIPYPPPAENGNWDTYQRFVAQFYGNRAAVEIYLRHLLATVTRFNHYTQTYYRDEPAIMAWELANEPRAIDQVDSYLKWVAVSSRILKTLDPNHLVTIGSEGDTPWPSWSGTEFYRDHEIANIDYGTAHVWVQNWGWFDPTRADETYPAALTNAENYIESQVIKALELNKPIVFEEFGIARDDNSYDPTSAVTWRDRYYQDIFTYLYTLAQFNAVSGANFWAYAGESRPPRPGEYWAPGDPFVGDPPHEQQGWYSVYDTDTSTLDLTFEYSKLMSGLNRPVKH